MASDGRASPIGREPARRADSATRRDRL